MSERRRTIVEQAISTIRQAANATERIWIYLSLDDWETAFFRSVSQSLMRYDDRLVVGFPYVYNISISRTDKPCIYALQSNTILVFQVTTSDAVLYEENVSPSLLPSPYPPLFTDEMIIPATIFEGAAEVHGDTIIKQDGAYGFNTIAFILDMPCNHYDVTDEDGDDKAGIDGFVITIMATAYRRENNNPNANVPTPAVSARKISSMVFDTMRNSFVGQICMHRMGHICISYMM